MRHRYFLTILNFLLSISTIVPGRANELDTAHTLSVEIRQFDAEMIDAFKADKRFQYVQPPETRPNWLKIMFRNMMEWLVSVLGNEGMAWAVFIIIIIVGAVGLGFAFYGLFGIGKTFPVYAKEKEGLGYAVDKENIHEINFPEEIEHALAQENFKKAIRLLYLFTLKLFTDHKLIDWRPSKTNHDYMYEIGKENFKSNFSAISYIFDCVWYGDFVADASHYTEMNNAYKELKKDLTNHA